MENEGTVEHVMTEGRQTLAGLADWVAASPTLALAMFALLILMVVGFTFLFGRAGRILSPPGALDTERPRPDPAAQRRMAGLVGALDRIGGARKNPAKRQLQSGQSTIARAVFEAAMDDHPSDAARGLALLAELDGAAADARNLYHQMYDLDCQIRGPRHPMTRQGAHLFAAYLRERAPDDPALPPLQDAYGPDIGR